MLDERRQYRSKNKKLALHYLFRSVAEQCAVPALFLSNEDGELLSSNLSGAAARDFASIIPRLAAPTENGESVAEREGIPARVLTLHTGEQRYYLCAVGEQRDCLAGLHGACDGVRRILAE
ncbi:MAG: hypothetical protein RBU37_11930 [Myxococcota bacterium]|jgi:hypothetical protein|nr:hypothetical protein [Myxococcota bacterium]